MSVSESQFVTAPILDARLQLFEARMTSELRALEARLDAKFQKLHGHMVLWLITVALGQSMLPKLLPMIEQWMKVMS